MFYLIIHLSDIRSGRPDPGSQILDLGSPSLKKQPLTGNGCFFILFVILFLIRMQLNHIVFIEKEELRQRLRSDQGFGIVHERLRQIRPVR